MIKIKKPRDEEKSTVQTVQANDIDNKTKTDYEQQLGELTDVLQRLQAEFENYKKRIDKENVQIIKNANANLIKELLPVLDSFELAIKNSNNIDNPDVVKFKQGMELIYAQFYSILQTQGLRIMITKDQRFDPFMHEVLMVRESDTDDIIVQEFQKGYMLNDIVLRHAKVMITKKKENTDGKVQ